MHRLISNQCLKTTIGIKHEAGVSASKIQNLLSEFASEMRECKAVDGMVGFLQVEDIPQHRRGEFMVAVYSLSA
jgi:hypothetical protein